MRGKKTTVNRKNKYKKLHEEFGRIWQTDSMWELERRQRPKVGGDVAHRMAMFLSGIQRELCDRNEGWREF